MTLCSFPCFCTLAFYFFTLFIIFGLTIDVILAVMVVISQLCIRNSCRLKTVPQHDCQNNYSTTTTQSNNKKMSNRNAKKFISKAKVESLRAQNLFIQVWDYDAGFPGIQNDDYLGRCGFLYCPTFSFFSFLFFLV